MPSPMGQRREPWALRTGSLRVAGVEVRWSAATFVLPALLVLSFGYLPPSVQVPALGSVPRAELMLSGLCALAALYAHEMSHVVAARAVGMPVTHMAFDSLIPGVHSDDDDPAWGDPTRRFWFALGGPLGDLLSGAMTFGMGWLAPTPIRFALFGYALGAGIQFLNALPTTAAGALFALAGSLTAALEPSAARVALPIAVAGVGLLAARFLFNAHHTDGDVALAAWREMQRPLPA